MEYPTTCPVARHRITGEVLTIYPFLLVENPNSDEGHVYPNVVCDWEARGWTPRLTGPKEWVPLTQAARHVLAVVRRLRRSR